MRKILFFLAVLILLTMLVLLPSQAESIPLPVVINGTGNNAVIIYSSEGCLSSGEIISMWSDGSDGFYFLGRMGDNLNTGLFHWQLSCRQLTLVSFSDAGSMKAAYPQTYSGPIPLTDGMCAVMDETMIRIVPQSQPGTTRKILSVLAYDQDASLIPLSVIDFIVNHPDVDVHYIDADLLDFDDSVLGENEKIDPAPERCTKLKVSQSGIMSQRSGINAKESIHGGADHHQAAGDRGTVRAGQDNRRGGKAKRYHGANLLSVA